MTAESHIGNGIASTGHPVTPARAQLPVPILDIAGVRKEFVLEQSLLSRLLGEERRVVALDGITLSISQGEVLGLVGESGCGKSTLAHAIARLTDIDAGSIRYRGEDIASLRGKRLRPFRHRVQVVFQDSQSSLNPRKKVGRTLEDSLRTRGVPREQRSRKAIETLALVGLGAVIMNRYPHELSGGQRQRVGIARALAMEPEFLIADEPVSSLDVSLSGQIVNLLMKLRETLGLTMLFVSHDLAIVGHVSTRVAVLYAGRVVEIGTPDEVLRSPAHPYTQALLASVPKGLAGRMKGREVIKGEPPDPANLPSGCRFYSRCPRAFGLCREKYPAAVTVSETHVAECHLLEGAGP